MNDGTITWRQLWDETATVHDRSRARWLCEEASGAFGHEFHDVLGEPATERQVAHLDAMLARLRTGEPLQYVLGHWSFRTLDLLVDRRVLIPRPETEWIAGEAIDHVRSLLARGVPAPVRIADLGTGSGAIGLSVASESPRGSVEVWLTDVSADALDVARANLAGLGMAGGRVQVALGSWWSALPASLRGSFDVVVANPPYIELDDQRVDGSVRAWEPPGALFAAEGGLADVWTIVDGAAEWLVPGGLLVLEVGSGQGEAVVARCRAAGLASAEVRPDLAGHDRMVVATHSST